MCFFKNYHESLYRCFKPYQYVGGESFSRNKDFESSAVRFAMAFPDKYSVGISNLGVRILYELINKEPRYMCDRVYAPEPDFQPYPLYALESKKPLKEFDCVGFSLQYELAYPTVLKMLEMSGIPYKNSQRTDDDPIIVAGGPCTYNPLPMSDFIDVFFIGDGEDLIVEVCKILEKTKGMPRRKRIEELCKNEGCWSKSVGGKVNKRIAQLKNETALTSYPIPFSSSIQDRAVVEIRRGCGRMCRFCQPGHVTLPIREREAKDIIDITKELVKNTGYDEYSLLSLSSNDYGNIKEVIKELAVDFNEKKISVSLPSQRIDGFNLELANLVQSVRKSTMTLAPEAGSQRLRDVIKKNITKEQILNAALTLYENGWSRVKFYFISGLPTETIEDMDELADLLREIRWKSKLLKKEKELKHSLDITCTLSIFVPKPFTPFQWCGQMNKEKVKEHISHLMERVSRIKGVKINYSDMPVSMLEAVLTRGNTNLCRYIEALYKKGCYLDSWGEYFNKDAWYTTSQELGINLEELAQKQYELDEELPWDFINTGLDKEWLKNEYKQAHIVNENSAHIVPTCQTQCVNCGVCREFKTKKVMAKSYTASDKAQNISKQKRNIENVSQSEIKQTYKYRIKLTKTGILKYFSHLDWQNTFFKAVSRTDLNVAFSYGFNPTMKISMGIALPLFCESECELVDISLWEDVSPEYVKEQLQKYVPEGCKIINAKKIDNKAESIEQTAYWAEYKIQIFNKTLYDFEKLVYNTNKVLSSDEILVEKKSKKGLTKKIDIKSSIGSYRFENESLFIVLSTGHGSEFPSVRADVLMNIIAPDTIFEITRTKLLDESLHEL